MKILQVTSPENAVLKEVETPVPGADEVLLKVDGVTTCPQWDLHLRHNDPMFVGHRFQYPYTPGQPGHEATGIIEAVGERVTDLAPGQCVSTWKDPGHGRPGCYAQFVLLKAEHVLPLPADLPIEGRASLELDMCIGAAILRLKALHALDGRTVGVTGLGPAGLIAVQMARAEGAEHIVGFDPLKDRCARALEVGADACRPPDGSSDGEYPVRWSGPRIETGIDCVGFRTSVEFLMDRTEEVVALFGVQREEYPFAPRHFRNLILCGYPGHSRQAAEYAAGLVRDGEIDLAPLVSHTLPLSDYSRGIDLLETREAVKVCFLPWAD